jgi:hypothetical protein
MGLRIFHQHRLFDLLSMKQYVLVIAKAQEHFGFAQWKFFRKFFSSEIQQN